MPIALYVICDHLLFRHGLLRLLKREAGIQSVGEGELSQQSAARVIGAGADVVLLSVHAPRASGPEAQRLYRNIGEIPVIVLLMDDDNEGALSVLRLGARSILDTTTDSNRLLAALRQATTGEITIPPRLAATLVADYAAISAGQRQPPHNAALSDREMDVLALLAHGHSNREIADELCLSIHTVRSHLRSVMQKLQLKNRVQAAAYAVHTGIGVGVKNMAPSTIDVQPRAAGQ